MSGDWFKSREVKVTDPVHRLSNLINDFKETCSRLSPLDDFAQHFSSLQTSLESIASSKGSFFKKCAMRFSWIVKRFLFVSLVSRRKIEAINALIEFSINSKNSIALAQGARALVEHVAVQAEILSKLETFSERIKGLNEEEKIASTFLWAENFLHSCYFGRSPKVTSTKEDQALHISDCLRTLAKEYSETGIEYDFLCEYVHPNHGSNSLVSSTDYGEKLSSITCSNSDLI